jgi:hypothetical protein
LFCVNVKRPIIGHLNVMEARVDELRRLKLRIADIERRIADEQGDGTQVGSAIGSAERPLLLQMLVRTLEALNTRMAVVIGRAVEEDIVAKSGDPQR